MTQKMVLTGVDGTGTQICNPRRWTRACENRRLQDRRWTRAIILCDAILCEMQREELGAYDGSELYLAQLYRKSVQCAPGPGPAPRHGGREHLGLRSLDTFQRF